MNFSNQTFVALFQRTIRFKAECHARDLFNEYKHFDTLEEREHLARQETRKFYQSGRILLVLKASWLGPQPQVISTYYRGFLEAYNELIDQEKTSAKK